MLEMNTFSQPQSTMSDMAEDPLSQADHQLGELIEFELSHDTVLPMCQLPMYVDEQTEATVNVNEDQIMNAIENRDENDGILFCYYEHFHDHQ